LYNPAALLDNVAPKEEDASTESSSRKSFESAKEEQEEEVAVDTLKSSKSDRFDLTDALMTEECIIARSDSRGNEVKVVDDGKLSIDPSPERKHNTSPVRVTIGSQKTPTRGKEREIIGSSPGRVKNEVDLTGSSPKSTGKRQSKGESGVITPQPRFEESEVKEAKTARVKIPASERIATSSPLSPINEPPINLTEETGSDRKKLLSGMSIDDIFAQKYKKGPRVVIPTAISPMHPIGEKSGDVLLVDDGGDSSEVLVDDVEDGDELSDTDEEMPDAGRPILTADSPIDVDAMEGIEVAADQMKIASPRRGNLKPRPQSDELLDQEVMITTSGSQFVDRFLGKAPDPIVQDEDAVVNVVDDVEEPAVAPMTKKRKKGRSSTPQRHVMTDAELLEESQKFKIFQFDSLALTHPLLGRRLKQYVGVC
jgi:hypothetical protein